MAGGIVLPEDFSGCGRPIRLRIQQVFTGVVGVVGVCLFGGMPAKASPRLQTWQFDTGQNRFMFTTEGSVQPQVSLGQNPNRLIIDLPGIVMDEAMADQFIGGAVQAVKVMQADARTTRMVLELDPHYTIDPQQVRVWGLTEAQWVVQLPSAAPRSAPAQGPRSSPLPPPIGSPISPPIAQPLSPQAKAQLDGAGWLDEDAWATPASDFGLDRPPRVPPPSAASSDAAVPEELLGQTVPAAVPETTVPETTLFDGMAPDGNTSPLAMIPPPLSSPGPRVTGPSSPLPPLLSRNQVSYTPVSNMATVIQGIQATPQGFFVPLAGAMPQVQVYRTRDANQMRQIVIDVLNAAIPPQLTPDVLPPSRYGISRWTVTQFPTRPPAVRITLNLDNVSPDWQVNPVAGGLLLLPIGMAAHQIATTPTTVVLPVIHTAPMAQMPPQSLAPAPPLTQRTAALPQREQILVMLDPGHGGADPGAIGIGGLQEKGVVIAVSHHAANALRRQGIAVQMTRQGDETLDLQPRVDRAANANATVFVSIHANAVNMQRPEVNGLETYYFSEPGLTLANAIHRRVMGSIAMNDRGVKQARFFVLRRTTMPAALIEIGFVTGALDAPKLRDPQWQAQMGEAIAQGILDYFQGGGR